MSGYSGPKDSMMRCTGSVAGVGNSSPLWLMAWARFSLSPTQNSGHMYRPNVNPADLLTRGVSVSVVIEEGSRIAWKEDWSQSVTGSGGLETVPRKRRCTYKSTRLFPRRRKIDWIRLDIPAELGSQESLKQWTVSWKTSVCHRPFERKEL